MASIYQIQQDLLYLFDKLEDNGSELTPEIEEQLTITQEAFKDKVENYINVIKSLDDDLSAIKTEQARLKALYERKEKVSNKLKEIITAAINDFGDTKKTGVKYLDYGTGEVSVRKSQSIELNDSLIKATGIELVKIMEYTKGINQLDVYDRILPSALVENYNNENQTDVNGDELSHINVDLSVTIPLKDLANGKGYSALKEIVKYSDVYKLSTNVSKSDIKSDLKENGACMPNLAKLKNNESLIIK